MTKIFTKETIGLSMIITFAIAVTYSYTQSQSVQMAGFILISLTFALLIGFVMKNIYLLSINICKWTKNKKGESK